MTDANPAAIHAPHLQAAHPTFDRNKLFILLVGLVIFLAIDFMPPWPDAVDPAGKVFKLSTEGKAAIALFLMAGMYKEFTGYEITFFELTSYLFAIGWGMVFLIWLYLIAFVRPEKKTIPGLKETVGRLAAGLGPMTRQEKMVLAIVLGTVVLMSLKSVVPVLAPIDRAALMLMSTLLFFVIGILTVKDLEDIPWNIVLLFSGAMSIGFCLWQTGAAEWLAVQWLGLLQQANWFVFVMGIAAFVLVMTNFIMNVAAIAIVLPVALVIAQYMGVAPDLVLYASLVTAGMPFVLLIGAAPNAIAYDSKQFTPGEFFRHGLPLSLVLLVVLGLAIFTLWPLLGMPILAR